MNKQRKSRIEEIAGEITDLQSSIIAIRNEEQEYMDNIPYNMQSGKQFYISKISLFLLNDAIKAIDKVFHSLNSVTDH